MKNGYWSLCLCLVFPACGDDATSTSSVSSSVATASGAGGGSTASGGGGSGGSGTGGAGGSGGAAAQNQFLYVANRFDDSIGIYRIESDGSLTSGGQASVISPGSLALTPDRTRLYAAMVQPKQVSAFAVDPSDGALTPIGTYDVGIRPVYISVDATAGHLLVASYGDNAVQTHALASDGSVAVSPTSTDAPGTNPHAIVASPDNNFVFVPVTNADNVAQYTFDASSGVLAANTPSSVPTPAVTGPRHLVFHPDKPLLYVVNEHADSVTSYQYEAGNGTLSALMTVSTLPSGADGGSNTCADIHVTPDGAFLYASNRGHNSLAMFALDAVTGLPTPLGHQATEPIPREFEITRDGRFLYAAGEQSDKLASYRIEGDGTLTELAVIDVGDNPWWVTAITVDQPR